MLARTGGSHYAHLFGHPPQSQADFPTVDLADGPRQAKAIAAAIRERGLVASAHDVSDGGPLVAIAEMLIAGLHVLNHPLGAEWPTSCRPHASGASARAPTSSRSTPSAADLVR
ncbi:MAG: AIR synthase-related protein [Phycisphaerales bacterium]